MSCPAGARFRRQAATTAGPTTWTYFDVLGRPVLEATQSFNVGVSGEDASAVCTAYDAAGRPIGVSNPFFLPGTAATGPVVSAGTCTAGALKWTVTDHDALGRVTGVTRPDSSTVQSAYSNLTTTVTDPRGKTSTEYRNAMGELVRTTDALGSDTIYSYNADGSLFYVHRDVGRGQIRNVFYYDALGRKVQQLDTDAGTTFFEYNALGELIAQQHADGSRVEHAIDARGRVRRRVVRDPGGSVETVSTYVFDTAVNGRGQLASETITGTYGAWQGQGGGLAHSYARSYRYDLLGRPSGTTTVIDGVSYPTEVEYDGLGRPWKVQDASGRWAKTAYNGCGMAEAVCHSRWADMEPGCPNSLHTWVRRWRRTRGARRRTSGVATARSWTWCASTGRTRAGSRTSAPGTRARARCWTRATPGTVRATCTRR